MSDPNQRYVPQAYPKMLYRDRATYKTVGDEVEHDEALADGFMAYEDLPLANADGLELLTDDQLRAKLLDLATAVFKSRPRQELIFAIRFQLEAIAAEAVKTDEQSSDLALNAEADADLLAGIEPEKGDQIIYGSASHPEVIVIGGCSLYMAAIVGAAYADSGLSIADWNDTPPSDRDTLIQLTIDRLAEAGDDAVIAELGEEAVAPTPEPAADTTVEAFDASAVEAAITEPAAEDIAQEAAESPASAQNEPGAAIEADPLDHDHDGQPGGSLSAPEPDAEKAQLIADIAALTGRKPHPGTKVEKLRAQLEALTAPEA